MRFFIGFLSLLFLCCDAEKTERKTLSLCKTGIDSLLQSSQVKYFINGETLGIGYIDGHCLDSGKSLLLYEDRYIQVLEYGNFKTGHYIVDSVVLPQFNFEAFKNRQQIVLRNLNWNDTNNLMFRARRFYEGYGFFKSIYPYKDKIFGLTGNELIVMDIQKKSLERLMSYVLFYFFTFDPLPDIPNSIGETLPSRLFFDLIRVENDTIIVSRRLPDDGFIDTILVTLDGKNFVSKIRDDFCLEIKLNNGERKHFGDIKRCLGEY